MGQVEENVSIEDLQAKMNRPPTKDEAKKIENNMVLKSKFVRIAIKEGFEFISRLRKEARRQKAMKEAQMFEVQAKDIECVPDVPSQAMERQLADSFEIYEED